MDHDLPRPRPEALPPILTQADLEARWRLLMGDLGFSRHTVWLLPLDGEGRTPGLLIPVEEMPEHPVPAELDQLMEVVGQIAAMVGPGGSVAFLLTRPGPGELTRWDRTWAQGLVEAAARAGLRTWPVHLANDVRLRVFAPDDAVRSA